MNFNQKADDTEKLAERLDEAPDIPYDELAECGIVLPVIIGLNLGPTTKDHVKIALYERAEMYRFLAAVQGHGKLGLNRL